MSYLEKMFNLDSKTAIISGGAGAIGLVMSEALLRAGANVVVWSRSQESIDAASSHLNAIEGAEGKVFASRVDAGVEAQVEKALKEADAHFGKVDILINGVGGNIGKSAFVDTDMETFQKVLHMNLVAGLMIPTKIVAAYWIEKEIKGSIINLTSMASYNPLSGVWAYDAAKAATLNLTMASANEFARYGIRVNAIAPGFFLGKQNKALLVDQKTGEYTARGKSVIAHTPYGRFGDVSELAGTTVFLASEAAAGFITGVSIPVDGGYLIHNI
ncbi:SDR family NAD(P)-dependent oxidoreductase [Desulforhopalus sp. IMCC35007]|uniref:SDR family NAD(P)-dependent oxidoreductase n=1 Tax=Desulforhopalus sp. IMCC35007 TaxID=2569543 RepID=UPI0010AE5731|nr:SDR family NAD(P)-dependent oxidoreductase [Desulforhopalus sp. IMCC35007]TKB06894.1 SDR family oxidoreductase [Desulforhopalus sp. IMCC35007]